MSAEPQLFETAIIISPVEKFYRDEFESLPPHINVVEPFTADSRQATKLAHCLAKIMFRNRFEITLSSEEDRVTERMQRLGGSILHNVREDIIETLDTMKIEHTNEQWPDGTTQTWYSGTWKIPDDRRTEVNQVYMAQETPSGDSWRILKTYDLKEPSDDFWLDPLYLDSKHNPVQRRKK